MTLRPLISCPPGSLPAETASPVPSVPWATALFRQVNQCCLSHPGDWGDCSGQTNPQLRVHPQHHTCTHNLCLLSLKSNIRASTLTQPGRCLGPVCPAPTLSVLASQPDLLVLRAVLMATSSPALTSTSGCLTVLQSASQ